ncbi:MAG: glutamine synthetase beta-grasp domain-containing protein [Geobacter sp.]|nr:glutamine synthetase beta-grasp domain-containing protein [Geobacter sp.]
MTPQEVVAFAKENGAMMVDFKFMDFVGIWQHFSVPMSEFGEDTFEEGQGFDGSSIRGWQPIHASDMIILPDPTTAKMDPFTAVPTLSLICNIFDPITKEDYSRDPRNIARKAEAYLKSTGVGDTAYFGPEAEFFIFDDVRYDSSANQSFYAVDSVEGTWNTGREEFPNLGYKPRHKEGYFPVSPTDSQNDLRNEMVIELQKVGIRVECQHHEVATGGQAEIDMRFNSLVAMADDLQWFKYVIKNVACRNGKTVTFMPKPLYGDNGSGMHCHQSIWKAGTNLFAGDKYGGLSQMALWYIGGIIKHAKALCASIRIPMFSTNPKAKRIEYRTPDPSANGYLAFAAMLMAGLDGVENKIDPGQPLDKDIYGLSPEELKDIPSAPGTLEEALNCLKDDHEFLLKGDVFTPDVIEKWIEYKMEAEVNPVRMRPVPLEFALYYDI